MKKYLLVAISLVMFVGISPANVLAIDESTDPSITQTEKQTEESNNTREKRLEEYKAKLKTLVSVTEQTKLKGLCASSQGKIKSLTSRVNNFSSRRTTIYDNLKVKIADLLVVLDSSGADTTTLTSSATELNNMILAFGSGLDNYQITLTDLTEMDCESDPSAFKAGLEEARNKRTSLKEQSDAIKSYIIDIFRPELQTTKADLNNSDKKEEN